MDRRKRGEHVKTIQLEKTSPSFRKAVRLARRGVLVLTERGAPAFALVGVSDKMALEALALGRNAAFMAYLDELSRHSKRQRTFSTEEIREEFGLSRSGRPKGRKR